MRFTIGILLLATLTGCSSDDVLSGSSLQFRPPGIGSIFTLETQANVPPLTYRLERIDSEFDGKANAYLFESNSPVWLYIAYESNGDVSIHGLPGRLWFTLPIASRTDMRFFDSVSNGTNSYSKIHAWVTASDGDTITVQGKLLHTVRCSMFEIMDHYFADELTRSDTSRGEFHWSPELGFYTRRVWRNMTIVDSLVSFDIR
jgi:hypothetical protein